MTKNIKHVILGDIDQPHTYAFVDDVARGLIRLAEENDALGQIWQIPTYLGMLLISSILAVIMWRRSRNKRFEVTAVY